MHSIVHSVWRADGDILDVSGAATRIVIQRPSVLTLVSVLRTETSRQAGQVQGRRFAGRYDAAGPEYRLRRGRHCSWQWRTQTVPTDIRSVLISGAAVATVAADLSTMTYFPRNISFWCCLFAGRSNRQHAKFELSGFTFKGRLAPRRSIWSFGMD